MSLAQSSQGLFCHVIEVAFLVYVPRQKLKIAADVKPFRADLMTGLLRSGHSTYSSFPTGGRFSPWSDANFVKQGPRLALSPTACGHA